MTTLFHVFRSSRRRKDRLAWGVMQCATDIRRTLRPPGAWLAAVGILMLVVCLWPRLGAAAPASDYAVVVSRETLEQSGWKAVVDILVAKHHAAVLPFKAALNDTLPELRRQFPRYVCFVARPEEASREFVAQVHRLTRQFDADP